jgi:hypothetical protein
MHLDLHPRGRRGRRWPRCAGLCGVTLARRDGSGALRVYRAESAADSVRGSVGVRGTLQAMKPTMQGTTRSETLRVRLRPVEAQALRELAAQDSETTVSMLVRRAINRYIKQEIPGKAPFATREQIEAGRIVLIEPPDEDGGKD